MNKNLTDFRLPDFQDRLRKEGDILRAAQQLFMQFGYKKVTVEEICHTGGVSKVTFYKYFSNKFALLEDYMGELMSNGTQVFERIRTSDTSFQDKMQAMIAAKESAVMQFTPVFLNSLLHGDAKITNLLTNLTEMSMQTMKSFFSDAQAAGEIAPAYPVDFLLHVWNLLSEDTRSPAIRTLYGDNLVKLSQDMMNFLFYGTIGPPRKAPKT